MDIQGIPFIAMALPMGVRKPSKNGETCTGSGDTPIGKGGAFIAVSCCLNINKYFKGLTSETGYTDFYLRLRNLRMVLNHRDTRLTVSVGADQTSMTQVLQVAGRQIPFLCASGEQPEQLDLDDYEILREQLWNQIFPPDKKLNIDSRVPNPQVGTEIVQLASPRRLPKMEALLAELAARDKPRGISAALPADDGPDIAETLKNIRRFGTSRNKSALIEKFLFIQQHADTKTLGLDAAIQNIDKSKRDPKAHRLAIQQLAEQIANVSETTLRQYINRAEQSIDIDEVIHNFSGLSNEAALMRVMGLTRDFEIKLRDEFLPAEGSTQYFNLKIELHNTTDVLSLPTRIKGICRGGKYAYLVAEDLRADQPHFFEDSILKVETKPPSGSGSWISHLYTFDKVAHELKLQAMAESAENDSRALREEADDSFTRGIVFGNTGLEQMVKPAPYPFTNPDDASTLPDDFAFTEDFVAHGQRVGVVINGEYHTLTGRRLSLTRLKPEDDDPFFVSDRNEGPIHCDAVSNFVENGKLKSGVTDALFEYSGELLGLKSAFSRSIIVTKADKMMERIESHDDGGLSKSKERVKKAIEFVRFPDEPNGAKTSPGSDPPTEPLVRCHYDLPRHFTSNHSPRLRFNKKSKPRKYTFAVYQEYLNGWGLPLEPLKASPLQLSVKELTLNNAKYLPHAVSFDPLENKKPLLLFHQKEVQSELPRPTNDDEVEQEASKAIERQGLDTLVVWSETAEDRTRSTSRHVLPARIAFEHAFWYDLLSGLDGDDSFNWKRKYNCPFLDEAQYDEFTKNDKECPENSCSSYCGGTAMRSFYPEDHIVPNHLSDPSITGFRIFFFRDPDCKIPIGSETLEATFGGTAGLAPQSYLMVVDGSRRELEYRNSDAEKIIDIRLKGGLRLWAQLENIVSKDYLDHLCRAWYQDLAPVYSTRLLDRAPDCNKNPPRTISIIHALRRPVMTPEMDSLSSQPAPDYKYKHVAKWLNEEYPGLTFDKNVVATRVKTHEADADELGSTSVAVRMAARFERLDAYRQDGQLRFVPNQLPTGGLELWMRKEEYIDDPGQIVLTTNDDPGSTVGHSPEKPVVSFDNDRNVPHRDHVIEFNDAILNQLRTDSTISGASGDTFRDVTSRVDLTFNANSMRFEERRYELRNTSLFKGHFTNNPEENDQRYSRTSDEHRVLLLNNAKPEKPSVSHAVTTITEVRTKEHGITTSTQKGNTVTVYLKRGRLTSGKHERVGVIVYYENSSYHDAFKAADLISKAGRDIVSDPDTPTASPFIRYDPEYPSRHDIVVPTDNRFKAHFDPELGIMSYLPEFDEEKQLWKFEVELDIKTSDGRQLHNPFVLFSLVHFQPFSLNYNSKSVGSTLEDIKRDFRISEIEPFVWCYLLPERRLSVSFDKPGVWGLGSWTDFLDSWGDVDMTLSFDGESLHHFAGDDGLLHRSNFILSVEGSNDRISWHPVLSKSESDNEWRLVHPLLRPAEFEPGRHETKLKLKFRRKSNPGKSGCNIPQPRNFSDFRVRLVEVEWFSLAEWENLKIDTCEDLVENEGVRVRYVDLIY